MSELEELTTNRFKAQHAITLLQARVKELEVALHRIERGEHPMITIAREALGEPTTGEGR